MKRIWESEYEVKRESGKRNVTMRKREILSVSEVVDKCAFVAFHAMFAVDVAAER